MKLIASCSPIHVIAYGGCSVFILDHVNVFPAQLLWLPGPYMSEEEGAEGQDGVAWLSGEMWREVPQKRHQKPEVQHLHLCAWGELDFRERQRPVACVKSTVFPWETEFTFHALIFVPNTEVMAFSSQSSHFYYLL